MIYTMRARTHTRTCCNYCTHTHTHTPFVVVVCLRIFTLSRGSCCVGFKTNHFCNNVSGAAQAQAGSSFSWFYFKYYFSSSTPICAFGSLPFAFCLRRRHLLSPFAWCNCCCCCCYCFAATWHSDCSNSTENVACTTAAFSLLRASVVPATLTSSLTPTPTTTTQRSWQHRRPLVFVSLQWIVRTGICLSECVCVSVAVSAHAAAVAASVVVWRRGMQKSNVFFWCLFYFVLYPLRWAWLQRNIGYIGFV